MYLAIAKIIIQILVILLGPNRQRSTSEDGLRDPDLRLRLLESVRVYKDDIRTKRRAGKD